MDSIYTEHGYTLTERGVTISRKVNAGVEPMIDSLLNNYPDVKRNELLQVIQNAIALQYTSLAARESFQRMKRK